MNFQKLTFWRNSRRLTSLILGVFFLTVASPSYAEFKPRDREPASGYSNAGGSRGCSYSDGIPLTVLAPKTYVGKTASKRPTFAWYMSSSEKVRFRLFEFISSTDVQQIGEAKEIPAIVGINTLKLPKEYPELSVGKRYFWQIATDCGGEPTLDRADITVVNSQSLANKKLAATSQIVENYARKELWYEAFAEASKTNVNGKLSPTGSKLLKELAVSEILTGSKEDIELIEQRIKYLRQISQENLSQAQ